MHLTLECGLSASRVDHLKPENPRVDTLVEEVRTETEVCIDERKLIEAIRRILEKMPTEEEISEMEDETKFACEGYSGCDFSNRLDEEVISLMRKHGIEPLEDDISMTVHEFCYEGEVDYFNPNIYIEEIDLTEHGVDFTGRVLIIIQATHAMVFKL